MIKKIITFSVQNKLLIGLFTITIIVAGLWSASKIPVDAVPDITNNQVQIITQSPNLGTEDIEQLVTYPVEVAVANLAGVTEIRSISRFGLSVVTVVFEDDLGTYIPRQLVAEKINAISKEIPKGFGTPEMGPISTGLGEIFQYTLTVDPQFKDKISLTDLRTIQDWIITRQMALVPGVVEINTIGGSAKQYEIAVDPNQLKSLGITITDVFKALKANNQNTGGAYIEKNHLANFIRGEGLIKNISDIENIVAKNTNNTPITIANVAQVQFGNAVKFGAVTQNGEGETVGGMIMMLKGANSNEVVRAVKERLAEIQKSLPEGVTITALLDRSKLIKNTTSTVTTNLIEGALIVIFVLVILLGNWRGGLIVASTIPLSLLFAFILMYAFDVWANLMSLGAIDFGIIIDGAVIIVESTVFMLSRKINSEVSKDKIAIDSSSKMMNSAFFGQLIILIVFIPILALEGIEGKMFQPMALTFIFAMIGVMILCLTYIPMMSAWFLSTPKSTKLSWGDRLVHRIENKYSSLLGKVLQKRKTVFISAVVLLGLSLGTFSQMGGEFIPQLDEGDIAFHAILKPGSSLSETVQTTTQIEKLVKSKFSEVDKIVSKIGVAEVPTDPMPMDLADIFVILKPESEWVNFSTKKDFIDQLKDLLEQIPGVNYEFSQPIEMRFNELLEGIREDIAIKLYGDDIQILASKADEIAQIIQGTPGIGDMKVESTTGLPQITVKYNRNKLAQYGLNIEEINTIIQSSFAGGNAGVIFEGEKRFDLVVRINNELKTGIEDLQNLYIQLPNESQIPLKEVAHISYETGPMQISRDNTNRRIYVGINVRDRDVESLVNEIKAKLEGQLTLPPGYFISYGGTFENLEKATSQLRLVVPIALVLIFILIFFALKSLKQVVIIFLAIPFASIGGIFSLWLRDMPFSISAGVGFIVLFGVAVLNGLVLMSSWNELKTKGMNSIGDRIKEGAKSRIRPILLTALTDILGFLPMALSMSAGAEVQQPLATVVIGGMISATVLTLFVLPVLYQWIEEQSFKFSVTPIASMVVVCCFLNSSYASAQSGTVITDVDQLIKIGQSNNAALQIARSNITLAELNKKSDLAVSKMKIAAQYGQLNSFDNDLLLNVQQDFNFPTYYVAMAKLANQKTATVKIQLLTQENQFHLQISDYWNELSYLLAVKKLYTYQDSILDQATKNSQLKYELQEANLLELSIVENSSLTVKNKLLFLETAIQNCSINIKVLLNDSSEYVFRPNSFQPNNLGNLDSLSASENPLLLHAQQQIEIARSEKKVEQSKMLPTISLGYFNQSMTGALTSSGSIATHQDRFSGVQAGVSIPVFYGSYRANIQKAELDRQIAETNANYYEAALTAQFNQQLNTVLSYQNSIINYQKSSLALADLILSNSTKNFDAGSMNFQQKTEQVNQAIQIKLDYLETVKNYNQALIQLQYITTSF